MQGPVGYEDACYQTECQVEGEEEQEAARSSGEWHQAWWMVRESGGRCSAAEPAAGEESGGYKVHGK